MGTVNVYETREEFKRPIKCCERIRFQYRYGNPEYEEEREDSIMSNPPTQKVVLRPVGGEGCYSDEELNE